MEVPGTSTCDFYDSGGGVLNKLMNEMNHMETPGLTTVYGLVD